jgi:isopenicillin N synthase-like dioxygenase
VLFDDMLETWTNGLVQATGHRVRRPVAERYSIVMFVAVDEGVVVRPLPQFVEGGTQAAYAPVEQASHIAAEMARARHNAIETRPGK